MMKIPRHAALGLFAIVAAGAADASENRDRSFDTGWRFLRADAPGADVPGFSDSAWRTLDLPHDWSIEDLPQLKKSEIPELPVTAGEWRFQKGDDAAWKARELNDGDWQKVTLPDNWEHHSNYTDGNAYGWFRRHIEIPADCKGKDFDFVSHMSGTPFSE